MANNAERKNRLGRGLDSLIPTGMDDFSAAAPGAAVAPSGERIEQVSPDDITANPHQPRDRFEPRALADLASSIRQHGILQPLIVTRRGRGYELIAGERRLRAARQLGLGEVPVIVREFSEQQKLEVALIENIQREDLNPLERALAYRQLIDQFNLTQDQIGDQVGKDRTSIANSMRLLGLPKEAKQALTEGRITESHARTILMVEGREKQLEMLDAMLTQKLTIRQSEEYAHNSKKRPEASLKQAAAEAERVYRPLAEQLRQTLATKVSIQKTARGGRIVVEYYSDEELERIYNQIVRVD